MKKNISIIGLGKLGACMAAAYAEKGHKVIGLDINLDFVNAINDGKAPVKETDLEKYITKYKKNISATQNYNKAINKTDITFIIVPTPSEKSGEFSIKYVLKSCASIGEALKNKTKYHLIVLTSTVLPQGCEEKIIPEIEKHSGKKCGKAFGFCYSPEFIAIGSVIHDLLNPDFFLIGEFDKKSGNILEDFYKTVSCIAKIKRMSITSAELTKISLNHYLTTKITYANMLLEIADKIPGVNVEHVTDAIGSDTRIGGKYLKGGLGFGGPCFPRDNRAFASMALKRGINVPLAKSVDTYNKSIINKMLNIILDHATPKSKIGILGLSYKPGTGFCEESQGLIIAKKLVESKMHTNVFEFYGYYHAKNLLKNMVNYMTNLNDFIQASDILFLTHWDKNNEKILNDKNLIKNKIIIDPWRQFYNIPNDNNIKYIPLGIRR